METLMEEGELDLQEQIARIRHMVANTEKTYLETQKVLVETQKVMIDTKVVSITAIFQGFIAIAALLGAGAAIAKLFFP